MADIKDRAREYIAKNSEYSEIFGQTFFAVDTLTAMVEFAEQETKELEAQIDKLIDFVLSKTECCDVCPITDTCINSEGTCPYAGILAKGEEEVTREWIMQKIAKEIKEK